MPPPGPEPERPPFPGLEPYGEEDAEFFFGRARERDLIVADMLTSRLTVVYGPSGIGKSSLLRAGVLPRLRDRAPVARGGSDRVVVLVDRWQRDSVSAIRDALDEEAGRRAKSRQRVLEPIAGDLPLAALLQAYGKQLDAMLLLILDQFEEHFLYHPAGSDRLARELPLALADPGVRARVVISLRDDALAQLDGMRRATASPFENLLRLEPMSDERAEEAIRRPIERYGELHPERPVTAEPGLAEHVLGLLHAPEPFAGSARGAATREEGVEPAYLQLVMRRLWDRERAGGSAVLRVATLQAMGGVRKIVAEHLKENMERLTAADQRVMAKAFHYLVTPSGAKIAQRRIDLAKVTGAGEQQIATPLETLSEPDARILRKVDDDPRYEVFHDVLAQPVQDWQARFHAARLQRRAAVLGFMVAATAAIAIALATYIAEPGWLHRTELAAVDTRLGLRDAPPVDPDIVIVDLDDDSLAALGGGRDRIPRDRHAEMIEALLLAGPAVIAYDIEFRDASQRAQDRRLLQAIDAAGDRIVLAALLVDDTGAGLLLGRSERVPRVGFAGFPLTEDDAYRQVDRSVGLSGAARTESEDSRLPSLAVVAATRAGEPPPDFRRAWIDYHGPARTFPYRSFADVLRAGAEPADFQNKIVVVGTSARAQGDLHPTERDGGRMMPGAEIQANAISTLRRGLPVESLPRAGGAALIALLGLLPLVPALLGTRLWASVAIVAAAAAAYLAAAAIAGRGGTLLPVVYPLLALLISGAALLAERSGVSPRARS